MAPNAVALPTIVTVDSLEPQLKPKGTMAPEVDAGLYSGGLPAPAAAAEPKKYKLPTNADGKATTYNLLSFAQPHMRALWWETIAFFVCFNAWFAIPAMATTIRKDMGFTPAQMADANSIGVAGTILSRIVMGVVCDKFGPRYGQGFVLFFGGIPVALAGLATSYSGYVAVRWFISFIGAAFVPTQYHMSFMFAKNVVGEVNALSAGWGNMGGGTTHLLMPVIMNSFSNYGYTPHMQWRLTMIIPGVVAIVTGICVILFTRDLPEGNYRELQKKGLKQKVDTKAAVKIALSDYRTYIFALNYAVCFGIELTIDSTFPEFYADHFKFDKVQAGAAASAFGLMNIFSRWSGGKLSDICAKRWGMRGRLWLMWLGIVLEGVFLVIFARMENVVASFFFMLIFSYWCQMSCGTTFGCVPYLNPKGLGAASGLIGAGGNAGAILTLQLFKPLSYMDAYTVLGCFVFIVPFSLAFVSYPELGGASMWNSGGFVRGRPEVPHAPIDASSVAGSSVHMNGEWSIAKGDVWSTHSGAAFMSSPDGVALNHRAGFPAAGDSVRKGTVYPAAADAPAHGQPPAAPVAMSAPVAAAPAAMAAPSLQ
eukprot:tig00001177_g7366.t1